VARTEQQPRGLHLRPIEVGEWRDFVRACELAFYREPHEVEYDVFAIRFPLERTVAAFDADRIVGTAGAFDFRLTVPGRREVAAAGVTAVGVAPTHRRRGVLTAMMRRQLTDYRDDGVPVAILWASESAIYRHFGYGLASWCLQIEVPRAGNGFLPEVRPAAGAVRLADPQAADAREVLAAVDETTRLDRPGQFARDAEWFRRTVADPQEWRGSMGPLQLAIHEGDTGPDGYALYAVKLTFEESLPAGQLVVRQLGAANPGALAALWRYLLDVDLCNRVVHRAVPLDGPVLSMLADPRRAQPKLRDNLYVRLADLPAALAARCYSRPVDAVLEVRDELCPWNDGRWRLAGDESGASCERTSDPPDLALRAAELGAAYLGGPPLAGLAATGLVEECRHGALAATSPAFSGTLAPCCPEVF
jgi:predicted acetyltransferase